MISAKSSAALGALLCALLALIAAAPARAAERKTLRVGTSGDYAPWSLKAPAPEPGHEVDEASLYAGFDIDVARAYAASRDLELRFVPFRWPKLLDALAERRFDVAMSGITMRSERSIAGRFGVPVAQSGALLLVPPDSSLHSVEDVERLTNVRVVVNAGGHLEQFAKERFPKATVLAVTHNSAVLEVLLARSAEAALTDSSESPTWQARAESQTGEKLLEIGPLSQDRKAYLFRPESGKLAADFDVWLAAREASGWLAALRSEKLGESEEPRPLATPLPALFAAIDERLSLMPIVGTAKRREGFPIDVPEREAEVLEAAVAQVRNAARESGRDASSDALTSAIGEFFRAQFDAAKQIQLAALRDELIPDEVPLPDVEEELRPALDRIGERIARLVVALPEDLELDAIRRAALQELRSELLSAPARERLSQAVLMLVLTQRASARAASPASSGTQTQTP